MRGDKQLINIRYNDGKFSRIPRLAAEEVVNAGRAKFVSNTLFRADKFGVSVTPGDTEEIIRTKIRLAKAAARKTAREKVEETSTEENSEESDNRTEERQRRKKDRTRNDRAGKRGN